MMSANFMIHREASATKLIQESLQSVLGKVSMVCFIKYQPLHQRIFVQVYDYVDSNIKFLLYHFGARVIFKDMSSKRLSCIKFDVDSFLWRVLVVQSSISL
ncbi:hypothetical protein AYI68_g1585 [Smittium mucronatum]|uniref:Uncharacterized protein n=1 Tax=Smittium mucronatum TaxID=133383 RepID=A0A1R0H598_9FUNG|nr:hypothetical protein AYI68_g1585 [Smittium mucronatum]